jgi:hypothetical protein
VYSKKQMIRQSQCNAKTRKCNDKSKNNPNAMQMLMLMSQNTTLFFPSKNSACAG